MSPEPSASAFPRALESYGDAGGAGVVEVLIGRVDAEPFNLFATLLFFGAIVHTFMVGRFKAISHRRRAAHAAKIERGEVRDDSVDLRAEAAHFLGEVEVVFGLWVVPVVLGIALFHDWSSAVDYLDGGVDFTEAAFVVVIMVLAATRPILKVAEAVMVRLAKLFGGSLGAYWLVVLTVGPALGSVITEPAAMTISALLLSRRFYELDPSKRFKYATLGLLFVNVSVGGTLTNFAAPPILMVAGPWEWGAADVLSMFGWKALLGVFLNNAIVFWIFRDELRRLQGQFALRTLKREIAERYVTWDLVEKEWESVQSGIVGELGVGEALLRTASDFEARMRERVEADLLPRLEANGLRRDLLKEALDQRFEEVELYHMRKYVPVLLDGDKRPRFQDPDWDKREDAVPRWVIAIHVAFMAWTVVNAHHPQLFILGLLFFLGVARVTGQYQNRIDLQPAVLVGFFLAALVIHGGLQGWWIEPVLGALGELPLMVGATVLTAFNDNAAITYLSTLVPEFTHAHRYAVVAGAVAGGGLTVIANAPNPAGMSILKQHFGQAVAPGGVLLAALGPTLIVWLCFALL